jgi:drug/metabolite transporter (DMT)-like permease
MNARGIGTTIAVLVALAAAIFSDELGSHRGWLAAGLLALGVALVAASLRGFGRRGPVLGSSPIALVAVAAAVILIGIDILRPEYNLDMAGFALLFGAILLELWQNRRRRRQVGCKCSPRPVSLITRQYWGN